MSSEFEWHFGDDLPKDRVQEERGPRAHWRRRLALFLVLLLAVGAASAWWRVRQRNLTRAEAQVEQVARVELRALAERDGELFLSLQDPTDRSWKEAQKAYLDTRGLPLPLQDLTSPISSTVERARIVDDRARVEIVYTATLAWGEEGVFRATRFYRYTSDGRWLHTRAEPSYAGQKTTFSADELKITACDEDAAWIARTDLGTRRLAAVPSRFCQLLPCAKHLLLKRQLGVDLEEARSLAGTLGVSTDLRLNLAANLEEAASLDEAVLPAPFLTGAPTIPAAQAAWEESLGAFLVDYLVDRETEIRSLDDDGGSLIEERLRAWLKAELGVSEPIRPNLELTHDALDNETWLPLRRLWHVEPGDPDRALAAAQIDLLLAFIEEEQGSSAVAELLQILRHADGMEELLATVAGQSWTNFRSRYLDYVQDPTAPSVDDLSAFDSYDLLIGCSEELGFADVWGWQLDGAEPVLLSARPLGASFTPVSWSPDGRRLVLQREPSPGPGSGLLLLRAGGSVPESNKIRDGALPITPWFGPTGWSPDGSQLAYYARVDSRRTSGAIEAETRIVNVETTEEATLDGYFVGWAPDSFRLLYAEVPEPTSGDRASELGLPDFLVAQRDGTVLRRIGEGYAATWSPGGEQIAVVNDEQALVAYDLSAGRSMTLLDRDKVNEMLDSAGTSSAASHLSFRLAWSPDGERIAMGVSQYDDGGTRDSAILLARAQEHRLLRREPGEIVGLAWTSNGRWLSVITRVGESRQASEHWTSVIELDGSLLLREENAMVTWSPDGRCLALTRFGDWGAGLEIRDLRSGEQREIDLPGRCGPAIWNPGCLGQEPAFQP